jgi:hypothetical protein
MDVRLSRVFDVHSVTSAAANGNRGGGREDHTCLFALCFDPRRGVQQKRDGARGDIQGDSRPRES